MKWYLETMEKKVEKAINYHDSERFDKLHSLFLKNVADLNDRQAEMLKLVMEAIEQIMEQSMQR